MHPRPPIHNSYFDSLRLAASLLVFISHLYIIYGEDDPLIFRQMPYFTITSLGNIGVSMFFTISGYLITESWLRDSRPILFLKKRILRIYPALILNFLIIILLIAPLVTELKPAEYFAETLQKMPTLILGLISFHMPNLPGVFGSNPNRYQVNTPLWTLIFEVLCYLIICVAGLTTRLKITVPLITIIFLTIFYRTIFITHAGGDWGLFYCGNFLLGSCFYLFKDKLNHQRLIAVICLLTWLILTATKINFLPANLIITTYLTLYLALHTKPIINFTKYGDFSYGIYIYAWPLQQSFAQVFNFDDKNFWLYIISSFTVTLLCAAISWHLVEKKALHLKRKINC